MNDRTWAAIFDLDGLLVDSEPLQARSFNVVLEPHGITLTDADFEALVGFETIDNFRQIRRRHGLKATVEALMAAKDAAYEALVRTELAPRPGAAALVAGLVARNVPLAVASSSPGRDVHLSLQAVGLAPHFPVVVTADDVEATKPAPDLYLEAARRLGMAPTRCVALEDSGAGSLAARRAGIRCVAVPHKFTRGHDFSPAVSVRDSLADLTPESLYALLARPLPPTPP